MAVQKTLASLPERSSRPRSLIAAIGAIAVAAPSIASAETVVVKHRDHMQRDWHHAWHRDHGWRHHDKTVIIKNRNEG